MEVDDSPISAQEIVRIAVETVGQSDNPKWFKYRKNRITGSIFGKVIKAVDRPSPALVRELTDTIRGDQRDISFIDAIRWGKEHEKDALKEYERVTGSLVRPTGIWLFPNGLFGASPDGVVYERGLEKASGIVEVKCPYTLRDLHYIEMRNRKKLPQYLTDDFKLKQWHDHYHQVQGELYATKAPWCDFLVWTTKSLLVTRVFPSDKWADINLPKLKTFYNRLNLCKYLF